MGTKMLGVKFCGGAETEQSAFAMGEWWESPLMYTSTLYTILNQNLSYELWMEIASVSEQIFVLIIIFINIWYDLPGSICTVAHIYQGASVQ